MKKTIFIICLISLILPSLALADGGLFPPPEYWMSETHQKAVIFHENNTETMILSIAFRGDAKDFSWIVPTPSKPEVTKSSDELFTALAELTQPIYDYPRAMPLLGGIMETNKGVEIIETKKVEYYDLTILSADDPKSLTNWLNENKYQFPTEASYLLDDYIKNNWYFTAIKINTESVSQGVETQLREGHAVPLKFVFNSPKIVYPLRISGVAEYLTPHLPASEGFSSSPKSELMPPYWWPSEVQVLLYVFADHKKDLPGFSVEYANWIKPKDIKNLAIESNGEPWVQPTYKKYFLTKFNRYMQPAEMTYDLYFRDANDNAFVGVEKFNWQKFLINILVFFLALSIILLLGLISPGGLIFILCTLLQFLVKVKIVRALAWILQVLIFLITTGLGFLWLIGFGQYIGKGYFLYGWSALAHSKSIYAAGIVAWALFLIIMIVIIITQIVYQKRRK